MRENYDQVLYNVLQHEGGFVSHPKDPGGATNRGVTQIVYNQYRLSIGKPTRSVSHISNEEVETIYRERYADPIWFDKLPSGIDYALFDFAVNSGHTRAVKYIQRLVGASPDGIMGRDTLGKIVRTQDQAGLVRALCEARRRFVRGLKIYPTFGKGWERRIRAVEVSSLAMVNGRTVEETEIIGEPSKAQGDQTLMTSISESRRSKAAVVGSAGAILGAVPEAMELAYPAKEAFAIGKYAAIIGMLITLAALIYIIYVRAKRE